MEYNFNVFLAEEYKIISNMQKTLIDFENLLGAWSLYQTTDNYIQVQTAYPKDFKVIDNKMFYIKTLYDKNKIK